MDHILAEGFGWADFYKTQLHKIGVDAHEIVSNASSLQRTWAREKGILVEGEDLLFCQIKELQPDIIFFQDSMSYSPNLYKRIREEIPEVKKLIGWCCSPYSELQLKNFSNFDFVFACSQGFVETLKKSGLKAYLLNHAFEPALLDKITVNNNYPETDLIFIASFIISKDFHDFRLKLVENLIREDINISIYADIPDEKFYNLMLRQGGYLFSRGLYTMGFKDVVFKLEALKKSFLLKEFPKKTPYSKLFMNRVNGSSLFGIEMLKALYKSKIGFNSHGGVAGDYAANIRLFEVTGVGSCLVTDNKKNIKDFFEPDSEIVTYNSKEECVSKIKWLINNPARRKEIAEAGQRRTIKDHTFQNRAEVLNAIIMKELKK